MCGPGPATFLGLVLLPAGPSRHSCVPRSARCLGRAQPPGGTAAPRASRPAPRLTPGSGSALGSRFCPGPARLPPASAPTQVPHRSAAKKPRAEGGCGVLPLAQPQDWGGGGASDAQGAEQGTPWGPRSSPDARAEPAGSSAPGSSPGGARPPRSLGLGSRSELQGEWCPPRRSRLAPGQPRVAELGRRKGWRWQALPSAALCVSTWKHSSARVELCNQGVRAHVHAHVRAHVHARARFSGSLLRAVHDPVCSRGCGGAAGPILKLRERGAAPSLVSE